MPLGCIRQVQHTSAGDTTEILKLLPQSCADERLGVASFEERIRSSATHGSSDALAFPLASCGLASKLGNPPLQTLDGYIYKRFDLTVLIDMAGGSPIAAQRIRRMQTQGKNGMSSQHPLHCNRPDRQAQAHRDSKATRLRRSPRIASTLRVEKRSGSRAIIKQACMRQYPSLSAT